MTVHYKFGGSTASRTLNCPTWTKLSKGVPSGPESEAARLGTALHELVENSLNDVDYEPYDAVGSVMESIRITSDHVEHKVYPAVEAFEDLTDNYNVEYLTEMTMEMNEDIGGTADYVGWGPGVVVMGDYKSGDGHLVDAHENDQLLFYTMLLQDQHPELFDADTKVVMVIVQPSERKEQLVDIWETTTERVMQFKKDFLNAYESAKKRNTSPNSGPWCSYCPAEAVCPIKTGLVARAMRISKDSTELASLNEAMSMVDEVESWVRAVRKLAHEQAELGVKIDGWKLVAKRATRVWNDEEAVASIFKKARKLKQADYQNVKMKSPAQIEKVCKQKDVDFSKFEEYISSVSSGSTLAHEEDKRPELPLSVNGLSAVIDRLK
jgi:hypothetical protein